MRRRAARFDAAKRMLPEIQKSIEAKYHLDEPLWRQYLRYLGDLAHGDLGPSFQYRSTSVNEIIAQGLPVDATIGLSAIALALLIGGAIGVNAALRPWHRAGTTARWRSRWPASRCRCSCVAPLLILVFAVQAALAARGRLGARLALASDAAGDRTGACLISPTSPA